MKQFLLPLLLCCNLMAHTQATLDYSYAQSAVKNQARRGTCTAFGICAAFETSPLVPADMSEQYVFAMIKYNHYIFRNFNFAGRPETDFLETEGEMLKNYINAIQYSGLVPEELMPYDPRAPLATNDNDLFNDYLDITKNVPAAIFETASRESYKLEEEQYEYLDYEKAHDVNYIRALLQHGAMAIPVGYDIHSLAWGKLSGLSDMYIDYPVINIGDMVDVQVNNKWMSAEDAKQYDQDIEDKIINDQVKMFPHNIGEKSGEPEFTDGGHCVTIVGYTPKGFIIKNSWGTGWGFRGYAVVSYNYHRMFCNEGLLFKNFRIQKNGISGPFDVLQKENLRLKTLPLITNDIAQTRLSLFYLGPRIMPELETISLQFYSGSQTLIGSMLMPVDSAAQQKAFTCILPGAVSSALKERQPVRAEMQLRYFNGLRTVNAVFEGLEWKNRMYSSR